MVNWRHLRLDGDVMCNPLHIGMVNGLVCLQDEEAGSFQIGLQSNDKQLTSTVQLKNFPSVMSWINWKVMDESMADSVLVCLACSRCFLLKSNQIYQIMVI